MVKCNSLTSNLAFDYPINIGVDSSLTSTTDLDSLIQDMNNNNQQSSIMNLAPLYNSTTMSEDSKQIIRDAIRDYANNQVVFNDTTDLTFQNDQI